MSFNLAPIGQYTLFSSTNWNLLIFGKCYQQRNLPRIPISHTDYFPTLCSHFVHNRFCLILFCFDYFVFFHIYISLRQFGICSYSLVAASMATERILSLKSVGMFPIMRLSQSESAKQSAAYKNW